MSEVTKVKEVTVIEKVMALMDAVKQFEMFETEKITVSEMIEIKNSVETILAHRIK